MLLEVCIDSILSGIEAEKGGAGRVELCSSLLEGGLTPTPGFLKVLKRIIKIPIFVMIRPRGGDFIYSDDEIEIMKEDIDALKTHGADGFVFGILDKDGQVDKDKCELLINRCQPLPVTFHRAFDHTRDPLKSFQIIKDLGFRRILTSGQRSTALEGVDLLTKLNLLAEADENCTLTILGGAGINPENVGEIVKMAKLKEVHASAKRSIQSEMNLNGNSNCANVKMGSTDADEFKRYVTDAQIVAQILNNANHLN